MIGTEGSGKIGVGEDGVRPLDGYGKLIEFRSVRRPRSRLAVLREVPAQEGAGAGPGRGAAAGERDLVGMSHLVSIRSTGIAAGVMREVDDSRGNPVPPVEAVSSVWMRLAFLLGYLLIVSLAACKLAESLSWSVSLGVLVAVHALMIGPGCRHRLGYSKRSSAAQAVHVTGRQSASRAVFPV